MRHELRPVPLALLLLTALCLLSGCERLDLTDPLADAYATLVPGTSSILPQAEDSQPVRSTTEAILWFRYLDEPYLAPEVRTITRSASQTYEMALISQLLLGPGAASPELGSLFPEGTRVLSTVKQGRTMFVTFSSQIMDAYADEPVDWQESSAWRTEAPLRRVLCMQSLVATITENCDVDQVQVLVQSGSSSVSSLRLRQNYFLDDSEDAVLASPLTRDDSLLLGCEQTLSLILENWIHQDWARLYRSIAARDPVSGESRVDQDTFIRQMQALPTVTAAQKSTATLSADGTCATFAVGFTVLTASGTTKQVSSRILRLYRDDGLWRTSFDQLTGWMEGIE